MQRQNPETRERRVRVDDYKDMEDSSPTLLVEWSKLPDEKSAKREELYQHWLESSLYTNYLNDILSTEKDPSERLEQLTQYIQELARSFRVGGQATVDRYQAEIKKVMGICICLPTSTGWDKIYEGFLWLVSRTLGTPYALLLGCAVKQREFRLKSADRARLFSFLTTKKHLLYCDVLATADVRKGMHLFSRSPILTDTTRPSGATRSCSCKAESAWRNNSKRIRRKSTQCEP